MRLAESPFYLLGLTPACSRVEVEREGQKLMAMLEVGLEEARPYPTPVGARERTSEAVRQAMADLRDPARRLGEELWALIPAAPVPLAYRDEEALRQRRPMPGARALLGWGPAASGVTALEIRAPAGRGARRAAIVGGAAVGVGAVVAVLGAPIVVALLGAGAAGGGAAWLTRRRTAAAGAGDLGPVATIARAVAQQPTPEGALRVEVQLGALPRLDADGILAAGLLAAARGEDAAARLLIGSLEDADAMATPAGTLRGAAEYLMADALERGHFRAAAELARLHADRSPLLRFLSRAAVRIYGVYLPCSPGDLKAAWRRAPGADRLALAPLFERAQAAGHVTFDDDEDRALEVTLPADPLGAALVLHAASQRAEPARLRRADLTAVTTAWDRAFASGEHLRILAARAALLGGGHPDEAGAAFRDTVAREIAALARAAGLPLREDRGETARAAAYRLREALLNEFEPAAQGLRARVEEGRALPALEEWRGWLSLRALALETIRLTGQEGHRQVFGPLNSTGSRFSAWLYNARGETYLSNLIDRSLLSQAFDVASDDTVERLERNVSLGA